MRNQEGSGIAGAFFCFLSRDWNVSSLMIVLVCSFLHGCGNVIEDQSAALVVTELDRARTLVGPAWPERPASRPTTSGAVYLTNLTAQISVLEKQLLRAPNDIVLVRLARSLYHRYQITAELADAERARSLLTVAFDRAHEPVVGLAYAEVLGGFHEFRLALDVLDLVEQQNANVEKLLLIRGAIERAVGSADTIDDAAIESGNTSPTPARLVMLAAMSVERGLPAEASELLRQAQDLYAGTAPYMLAWIHVQQGIVFLRYEDYPSARVFFAAANERFPQFVLAAEHLAETELALGEFHSAAQRYRDLAGNTKNPEFIYKLSVAEAALGNAAAANQYAALASTAYQQLLLSYPAMFSDHAARYYLQTGRIARALELAQQNMMIRQDSRARTLLVETLVAAGQTTAACREFSVFSQARFAPPELALLPEICAVLESVQTRQINQP